MQLMNDPVEIIQFILDNWPVEKRHIWPKDAEEEAQLRKRFEPYLHETFNTSIFAIMIHPDRLQVSKPLILDNIAKVLVQDETGKLLAVLEKNSHWQVTIFTFQCATCFGEGIYGDEVCNVCGGTGWGTLGNVEFCNQTSVGGRIINNGISNP